MLSVEVDGTIMGEVSSFHTLSGVTNLEFSADVSMKVPKVCLLAIYLSLYIRFYILHSAKDKKDIGGGQ